jgi:hypothetical protein
VISKNSAANARLSPWFYTATIRQNAKYFPQFCLSEVLSLRQLWTELHIGARRDILGLDAPGSGPISRRNTGGAGSVISGRDRLRRQQKDRIFAMRTIETLFMVFAAGVMVAGLGIVALFMGTGPTANQIRSIDGPTEPVTQVSRRP